MTTAGLAERLKEMEDSPEDTAAFEVEDLLREVGFVAIGEDAGVVVYQHPKGRCFSIDRSVAGMPIGYVRHIARVLRSML